jgi:hypothetical protein
MLGMNGTTARDFPKKAPRYLMQWVTAMDSESGRLRVLGYCIRDKNSFCWTTVFEHESSEVCMKMLKILNEG